MTDDLKEVEMTVQDVDKRLSQQLHMQSKQQESVMTNDRKEWSEKLLESASEMRSLTYKIEACETRIDIMKSDFNGVKATAENPVVEKFDNTENQGLFERLSQRIEKIITEQNQVQFEISTNKKLSTESIEELEERIQEKIDQIEYKVNNMPAQQIIKEVQVPVKSIPDLVETKKPKKKMMVQTFEEDDMDEIEDAVEEVQTFEKKRPQKVEQVSRGAPKVKKQEISEELFTKAPEVKANKGRYQVSEESSEENEQVMNQEEIQIEVVSNDSPV